MLVERSDHERVVITGLGVVAPGATGLHAFQSLLREGRSGVTGDSELAQLAFACQVSGRCVVTSEQLEVGLSALEGRRLRALGLRYGLVAGREALRNSKLPLGLAKPDPRRSVVFGAGVPGIDVLSDAFSCVDAGRCKRLGSATIEMQMPSSPAALLAATLGAGGQVTANASACATGVEALFMGWQRIVSGAADVVLVGSTESQGAHLWGAFDALRVLSSAYNHSPACASRPLSASAAGFVPASGAGALVLERKSHALQRDAPIVCEVLGGSVNCGAQLEGGTMTAQNAEAARTCMAAALTAAGVDSDEIDAISGHLTATGADAAEVENWATALGRSGSRFPWINAPKSLWGHALSASGSIELVACALQLAGSFLHASLNAEQLHPAIAQTVDPRRVVRQLTEIPSLDRLIKASFGFGDVNGCAILGRTPRK